MKSNKQIWLLLFPLLVLLVISLSIDYIVVQASKQERSYPSPLLHVDGLHNATQKKDVTAWGVLANLTWTNPNLNGGSWSYHRPMVVQWSPWRFVEFGWQKTTSGFRGLVGYNDGSGNKNQVISGVSAATHSYSIQYDPNSTKYWFYVDGSNVWNVNANFSSGNAVISGGEVASGVECMGHTRNYNLHYLQRNANGTFTYYFWNGYVPYAVDAPYSNAPDGSNAFYDDGCGP